MAANIHQNSWYLHYHVSAEKKINALETSYSCLSLSLASGSSILCEVTSHLVILGSAAMSANCD